MTFRQIALRCSISWSHRHAGSSLQPARLLCLLHLRARAARRTAGNEPCSTTWRGEGADANDAALSKPLRATLAPQRDPDGEAVQSLKDNTARALALGLSPTVAVDGRLFWGLDSLAIALAAYLKGDAWVRRPGQTR